MASKRDRKDQKRRIHEQMLRYLDENPLPRAPENPPHPSEASRREAERGTGSPAPESGPRRPRLMLRKMPLEQALSTLERFLRTWRHQGVEEGIVVVGKGRGSPEGLAVIAPAVREWLDEHPEEVLSHEEAPAREGGSGAILVRLRP